MHARPARCLTTGVGNGGPLDGKSMGTAKKAGLVKTTVEDGLKGEQRIGVTLTLKNGKAYRYDEYINVK